MSYPADPNKHCPSTCAECCAGASPPVSASCCAGTYSSQQCGPGGCGPGSVLLSCGAFSFNLDLLSISAVGGLGWSFSLNYLAGNGVNGIVGSGFNYDQNLQLQLIEDTTVRLVTPSNCNEDFYDAGDGLFLPESDNNTRASIVVTHSGASDEVYTLYAANGTITVFFGFAAGIACPGSVQSITDRHGNSQTFAWRITGGLAQVTSVVDSYGRSVGYAYFGAEQGYRLQQITDFLGRQLNFQYDSLGHLAAVVTPSIERAAPGNAFPGGTAYVFQYDVENPRADRQDDLIRIWFPNQTAPMLDAASRVVDVAAVYASGAIPRYAVVHGQDPTDANSYGLVTQEIIGNPRGGVGGVYSYEYAVLDDETNPIDGSSLVFSATMSDRNGNQTVYKFNAVGMPACVTVMANREKIGIPTSSAGESYVTWTSYNANNQPLVIVYPAGNSTQYVYEDGVIAGLPTSPFPPRVGLLLGKTELPGNSIGVPSRAGSSGQTELSERYFHDPIFGQMAARIEARGNPIDSSGDFFTPQNGGTAPSDADCSRYASIHWFDYQKDDDATISADATLQQMLGLSADQIITLMDFVNSQMTATDGSGGLPNGFARNLGDINGDGTGTGGSSGLPAATHAGNVVMSQDPSVTLVAAGDPSSWTPTQLRQRLFTTNARGQTTTMTDAEGNLTVYVRYPLADPDGAGQYIDPALGAKQYGQLKETHVDADPNDVLSLVGADGDLLDFIPNIITRTNASGVYQDLVTRYEGSAAGCAACAYDALGNPLAVTDPRGGATRYDRNERGEVFRVTSPAPYVFQVETYYDANRNVVRVDTQDQQVAFDSSDPASACFGHFTPSGSGAVANVPMRPGAGGAIRPGWFSNLYTFDLLDNKIQDDIDATGSTPASLVTTYLYDPNQNLIQITKPNGNLVEYDYDERNLRIAQRIGRDDATDFAGAVTVTAFDANGNLLQIIGPAQRGASGNWQTAMIQDAFRSGATLTHTGDSVLVNVYDGFDRVFTATDSVGGLTTNTHDPGNRLIAQTFAGTIGGATPSDTSGSSNETLTSSKTYFDEAGRPYEAQRDVFMATGTTVPSGRSIVHIGGGLAQNSTANDHTASVTISSSPGPGNASYVLTRTLYDRSGRTTAILADNTAQTSYAYDGANRRVSETDALGNSIAHEYDPAGNVVLTTRTELSTITEPTTATEIFESAAFFDCLGRMIMTAQQGPDGNLDISLVPCPATSMWSVPGSALVSLAGFDSRGNQVLTVDPKGNTAVMVFDGASRNLQSIQHLRSGGLGQNGPAPGTSLLPFTPGTITTTRSLDGNGNLLQLIDDRNDLTSFQYDTMDRETEMTFHDGSTRTRVYDEASDVVTYTDENGSVFTNTFDPLGRKVSVSIAAASGIGGTTAQSFQFDGLSRMTFARDTVSSANADVTKVFDSLSRTLEESQVYGGNTRNVTASTFQSHPMIVGTFPFGYVWSASYDVLYRKAGATYEVDSPVATWQFFGPNRVAEITLGNGLICSWMNNARTNSAVQSGVANPAWGNQSSDRLGYDGAGRPITKRFLSGGINGTTHAYNDTTALVGFTTAYDASSNKLYERSLHCEERDHLYQGYDPTSNAPLAGCYDSLDRLLQYQRGILATTGGPSNAGGGQITTPISLPNADKNRTYALDGLGNWRRTAFDPGLVGHWPLTEGAGIPQDNSGFGNDCTVQVTLPMWSDDVPAPLVGTGLHSLAFDNNRLDFESNGLKGLQMGAGPRTVAAWVKAGLQSDLACIVGYGSQGSDRAFGLFITPVSGQMFAAYSGWSPSGEFLGAIPLSLTDWYHLALTYDGNKLQLYVNGVADTSNTYTLDTIAGVGVLAGWVQGGFQLVGSLADPRLYDRAFSAAEIAALATQTPGGAKQITEVRQHNGVNQITRVTEGSTNQLAVGMTNFGYDHGNNGSSSDPSIARRGNGNLANDGQRIMQWDALNRLLEVQRVSDSGVIQESVYDAFNRRIRKTISNGGLSESIPDGTADYLYLGWQCVEERNPFGGSGSTDTPIKQYIWGHYLDECLWMNLLVAENDLLAGAYYPLQDLLYRTIALADSDGVVREAYDYDAYGNTLIFRNSGSPPTAIAWTDSDTQIAYPTCEFLFTGQRYDAEIVAYYYKERYYIPRWGRFASRDPIGFAARTANFYCYANNSPLTASDSSGFQPWPPYGGPPAEGPGGGEPPYLKRIPGPINILPGSNPFGGGEPGAGSGALPGLGGNPWNPQNGQSRLLGLPTGPINFNSLTEQQQDQVLAMMLSQTLSKLNQGTAPPGSISLTGEPGSLFTNKWKLPSTSLNCPIDPNLLGAIFGPGATGTVNFSTTGWSAEMRDAFRDLLHDENIDIRNIGGNVTIKFVH